MTWGEGITESGSQQGEGAETHRADLLQQKGHTGGVHPAYRMGRMWFVLSLELLVKLLLKTLEFQLLLSRGRSGEMGSILAEHRCVPSLFPRPLPALPDPSRHQVCLQKDKTRS